MGSTRTRAVLLACACALPCALAAPAQAAFEFAPPLVFPTGGETPTGAVVADFNDDGLPDIASTNAAFDLDAGPFAAVVVQFGLGNGSFGLGIPFRVADYGADPSALAAADFDGDEAPDLAVANRGSQEVVVLSGRGTGAFELLRRIRVKGTAPAAIAVTEINGDGKRDIVVANAQSGAKDVTVIPSKKGVGRFGSPKTYATGANAPALAVGDVDGDRKKDVVVPDDKGDTVWVLAGRGKGTFKPATRIDVEKNPHDVALADLNGDGRSDLITTNAFKNDVFVRVMTKDDEFAKARRFPAGERPKEIVATDTDADEAVDLVLTGRGRLTVLGGTGRASFGKPSEVPLPVQLGALIASDVDADEQLDLVATDLDNQATIVVRQARNPLLADHFRPAVHAPAGAGPDSIAAGDFNGDAHIDLAVANEQAQSVSVLLATGLGSFRPAPAVGVGSRPSAIDSGDFNSDGLADLVVANEDTAQLTVLIANRSGGFNAPAKLGTSAGPSALAAADLDGDGRRDVAVASSAGSGVPVSVFRSDGSGGFPQRTDLFMDGLVPADLAVGDYDGNGTSDIAVADVSGRIVVFPGLPGGGSAPPTVLAGADGPAGLAAGDLDGDGDDDLVVAHSGGNRYVDDLRIWRGGGGGLTAGAPHPIPANPSAVALADLDGDDSLDVVTTHPEGYAAFLLSDGSGGFSTPLLVPAAGGPADLVAADFDEDESADLALANRDANDVTTLMTTGESTLPPPIAYQSINLDLVTGSVQVRCGDDPVDRFELLGPVQVEFAGELESCLAQTLKGTISITAAADLVEGGAVQRGQFRGGGFRVTQAPENGLPWTTLRLNKAAGCANPASQTPSSLHSGAAGRWRVVGTYGWAVPAAESRWGVTERCGATHFGVTAGQVTVRDLVLKKNVTLKAGGTYVARAAAR